MSHCVHYGFPYRVDGQRPLAVSAAPFVDERQ